MSLSVFSYNSDRNITIWQNDLTGKTNKTKVLTELVRFPRNAVLQYANSSRERQNTARELKANRKCIFARSPLPNSLQNTGAPLTEWIDCERMPKKWTMTNAYDKLACSWREAIADRKKQDQMATVLIAESYTMRIEITHEISKDQYILELMVDASELDATYAALDGAKVTCAVKSIRKEDLCDITDRITAY